MKLEKTGKMALGCIIAAAATMAMTPLMALADNAQAAEIASLKQQIYQCRHHKRHHHAVIKTSSTNRSIEKQIVIENQKPVVIEKIVEKQVQLPAEKEFILERPVELDKKVVVEHSAHRKHLIHMGIPFIGLNLF